MQSPRSQYGLSYIEMVIVVIILGIVAAAAMPDLSSTNGTKLDNATYEVTSAISFAQSEAIRTKTSYGVSIDVANDRLRVYRLPTTTAVYDVYHPIDKKLYDTQFKTDAYTNNVDIVSASFLFSPYNSSTNLDFSAEGIPKYTSGGTDNMLTTGSLTLSYHGQQRVIKIAPMTGRVTIE